METCLEAGRNTRQDYLGRSSALVADRTCRFCSWWTPGTCSGRTRRAWQDISGGSHDSHAARTSSCPPAFDPLQEVGSTSRGQFAAAALASSPCLWLPSSSASWCAKMRASGACPLFSIGSTWCWSRPKCSRAPEKNLTTKFWLLPNFHLWRVSSQLFCLPQMFLLYSRHKVTQLVHLKTLAMTLLQIHAMLARYVFHFMLARYV